MTDSEKKLAVLKSLYDVGKLLTSTLDLESVLSLIVEKTGELLTAKQWSLMLVDAENSELFFEIVIGPNAEEVKKQRLKIGEGIAGWVVEHNEPLLIPDVSMDQRFFRGIDRITGFTTKSVLCVPLFNHGEVLGAIELVNKYSGSQFDSDDLETLQLFADFIAIAIRNATNFRTIHELSIKDDLTCLFNTRFFHEMVEREMQRSIRKRRELSLIFMDMDHFKEVNDTHGHIYGSRLLKEVAVIISNCVRSIDIPVRYGGDEFTVILPETSKEQAQLVARRIHERIRENLFLADDGINIRLTASLGYATFPDDAKDKDELIKKADNAMYHVKNTTRNGVCAA